MLDFAFKVRSIIHGPSCICRVHHAIIVGPMTLLMRRAILRSHAADLRYDTIRYSFIKTSVRMQSTHNEVQVKNN